MMKTNIYKTAAATTILSSALLLSVIFSANVLAIPIVTKQSNLLSVCYYEEFKPIAYGSGEGYEGDMLRAISVVWKMPVKFYPEKIYEGIWRLPSRQYTKCDVAAGGITPTQSRSNEGTVFSNTIAPFRQSLLVRRADYKSNKITSYKSFKNTSMKIGYVPGTTGEEYARVRAKELKLPSDVFVGYVSESELLPALVDGKIDAIARGEIGNEYQAKKSKRFITIAKRSFNEGFSFAVDIHNKHLLEKLNQTISLLTDHGKIGFSGWQKDHQVFMKRAKQLQK